METRALEFEGLTAGYDGLTVVRGVSGGARRGQVTLLTGPNGAGKSTLLKALFGVIPVTAGVVRLDGEEITGKSPRDLLGDGIAFVPQGRNIFPALNVLHNLELGGMTVRSPKELQARIEEVLARFPRLRDRIDSAASSLSGGEQKMLEVGRALLLRPRVLFIDEPSIGLSPKLVGEVFHLMGELAAAGTTVLMVEQNVKRALSVCAHAMAMESGRILVDRPAVGLLDDPSLSEIFLGGTVAHGAAAPPSA